MNRTEQRLLAVGAVLVRSNRHRIYELNGERITVSHASKQGHKGRNRQLERMLTNLEQQQRQKR